MTRVCAPLVLLLFVSSLFADSDSEAQRRVQAGTRLFKALLAADLDLPKKAATNGELLLVIYYKDDRKFAEDLAASFRTGADDGTDRIRGFTTRVELTADPTFRSYAGRAPAGVYVAQIPDSDGLKKIIRYGIDNSVIVYSPFEGHVEKGVLGGLSVEAQVRPYVNAATLEASHIKLKQFFLKVTKVYQ